MDTNTTTTELNAVEHEIVVLTTHLLRIGIQQRNVLDHWRSEWVVRGNVATCFLIKNHQWEFNHPKEFVIIRINGQLLALDEELSCIETYTAEDRTGTLPLARSEEHDVAIFDL